MKCLLVSSGRGGTAAGSAVFLQQGHAAEGARTGVALVFLHICVGLQVRTQVWTVREGTVTVWAGERTLTWGKRRFKATVKYALVIINVCSKSTYLCKKTHVVEQSHDNLIESTTSTQNKWPLSKDDNKCSLVFLINLSLLISALTLVIDKIVLLCHC